MISSNIEEKQIELAERLSNYNEILQFVRTKIPEDELDIYLGFFKTNGNPKGELLNKSDPEYGKIVTMWGDEI